MSNQVPAPPPPAYAPNTPVMQQSMPPAPQAYNYAPASQTRPMVEDGGFMHFLRFLLVWLLIGLTCAVGVGIIWVMIALSKTGRRKRDILMFLIPVWGIVVEFQTLWRYSAKNVYWSVRDDRPSKPLFGG